MVLVLNGASSSGKTSTASALTELLGEGAVHLDIDSFAWERYAPPAEWPRPFNSRQAHYLAAAQWEVREGRTVVLEYIFRSQVERDSAQVWFTGLTAVWVHLHCPLPELIRRERQREDRRPGLAESQFSAVEAVSGWDLIVDTTQFPRRADRARLIQGWLHGS